MTSDSFWCSMLHTHFVGDKDVLRFNTWVLTAVLTVVVVVVAIVVQFLVSYLSVCPVAQLLSSSVLIRHHPATACNTTNFSREDGEYLYCSVKPHICKKKKSDFQDWSEGNLFSPRSPCSNHTSWLLTKSEGCGSHKTHRYFQLT